MITISDCKALEDIVFFIDDVITVKSFNYLSVFTDLKNEFSKLGMQGFEHRAEMVEGDIKNHIDMLKVIREELQNRITKCKESE